MLLRVLGRLLKTGRNVHGIERRNNINIAGRRGLVMRVMMEIVIHMIGRRGGMMERLLLIGCQALRGDRVRHIRYIIIVSALGALEHFRFKTFSF